MKPVEQLLKRSIINDETGPSVAFLTPSTITTAGAVTYTAAQILGGHINRDPNGAGRSDTLPTAALLVADLRSKARQMGLAVQQNLTVEFVIQNNANGAYTITVLAGTGGTVAVNVAGSHTLTVAQNNSKMFRLYVTTTSGSEAYVVYNLGTFTT